MNQARFKLHTGLLRAYEQELPDGTKRKKFRTTASSTVTDLAGDEMKISAIEKMAAQARRGMTIFLNHSYNVPEDVLGSCDDAHVIQRGFDTSGAPVIDLDFDIGLLESNPRAIQAWDAINSGVRLGTSIGAIVRHATKKKDGGLVIDDVDLLEASLVGIPANPRSWVHYAVRSIKALETNTDVVETEIEDAEEGDMTIEDQETTKEVEPGETEAETEMESPEEEAEEDEAPSGVCPSCGGDQLHPQQQCQNQFHKYEEEPEIGPGDLYASTDPDTTEVEPDKEAARTRVTVTVDSEPAPGASRSESGKGREAEVEEDATASALAAIAETLQKLNDAVSQATILREQLDLVTKERDEAQANLDIAKQLLSRYETLPLRRTAGGSFKTSTNYRKFTGVLDEEVIKYLEKKA